ncbi:MAG: DUF4212 domain-containing protein [Xanthomonadales bacterium]|nr:DUF4212 domain-containing protein [Xanthomonadales bacterium]
MSARPQAESADAAARRRHWRGNLAATASLLAVWAAATFVPIWWARELNRVEFFGWPLAYYMAAQGTLLVYLALVWIYAKVMARLDRRIRCGLGDR